MSTNCSNCQNNCSEEKFLSQELAVMPIAQHEKDQDRLMKIIKSLISVIIVLIVLFVGTNIAWIIYEAQFEVVEETNTTVEQDANNGTNNFIGGDVYGETSDKNKQKEIPQEENG
jgi:hypothetical protein